MTVIEEAQKELREALLDSYRTQGHPTEFDTQFNEMSRKVAKSMRETHGQVWAYKINLYDKDRGIREAICWEVVEGETLLNFSCSFVAPVKDEKVIDMILARDVEPYHGTSKDYSKIEEITARADEIGGIYLVWV
jgi:hypothetical protein